MHDRSFKLRERQEIAQTLLRAPETESSVLAEILQIRPGVISAYIVYAGGLLPFFIHYGGEWATEERMADAARQFLSRATEPTRRRLSRLPLPAAMKKTVELVSPLRHEAAAHSLGEHECHWIRNLAQVNSGDAEPDYCREAVSGIYCAEHSRVAAEEFKKRVALSERAR